MKIAIIHYRLVRFGGLETRFLNYIEYLHKNGHDITVIYHKRTQDIILPPDVKEIKINLGLMPKLFRYWYFNRKLGKIMNQNKFDFSLSLGRTSYQTAVLAPATHLGYLAALGKTYKTINDRLQISLDKKAYEGSRIVYACSSMIKEELISMYRVSPEKIRVLFPPLNPKVYYQSNKDQKPQLKQKYGMDVSKTSFLFVSTSHRRKGLSLLTQTFAKLQDEPFELCIVGYPKLNPPLKNIKYLGYFDDLREIYAAADFTIHPSVYEPFGQIISESLACGTPVLVSSSVGAKEILNESSGVVVDSLDPNKWVETLKSLSSRNFDVDKSLLENKGIMLDAHVSEILKDAL